MKKLRLFTAELVLHDKEITSLFGKQGELNNTQCIKCMINAQRQNWHS